MFLADPPFPARTSNRVSSSCWETSGKKSYKATLGPFPKRRSDDRSFSAILKQKYSQKPQLSSSHPMVGTTLVIVAIDTGEIDVLPQDVNLLFIC